MSDFNVPSQGATPQPPAKSGGSGCKIVIIVLLILGGLSAVCCCGIFGLGWWGFGQMTNAVKASYANHPTVVEQIGGIESCSYNLMATGQEAQDPNAGEGTLVFDVTGPKGSGMLIVVPDNGSLEMNADGTIARPQQAFLEVNGNRFPLAPDAGE